MNKKTEIVKDNIDWKAVKQRVAERLAGVLTVAMIGIFSLWYASFAKDVDVKTNSAKVKKIEIEVEDIGASLEITKDEVKDLRNGIKIVLSGMCIMNEKTCKLKEDFDND